MNEIPNIKLVDDRFEGTVSLPVWKEFQSRQGDYGSLDTHESSNGIFPISIGGDMVMDIPTITTDHINAYKYLSTHSVQIRDSILTRLFADYKNLQLDYGYNETNSKEIMPDIENVEDFKKLIGLSQVHLMNVGKDSFAYVGYEFGCTWDNEHGLGFMMHKDRIIDFGGADTSFLTWIANNDLKSEASAKASGNCSMPKAWRTWWQKLLNFE
jgi:hypothetical protein